MTRFAIWLCRGCGLLLCCAAITCGGGCHSTNNSSSAGGVSQNQNGSWNPFATQPKKVQTPSDFINQPRPGM